MIDSQNTFKFDGRNISIIKKQNKKIREFVNMIYMKGIGIVGGRKGINRIY